GSDPIREVAADEPGQDDGGGEGGERGGTVRGPVCLEVEDDERRHRRVADVRERDAHAWAQRLARDEGSVLGRFRRRVRIGYARGDQRADERADRGEDPDGVETGRVVEGLA